MGREPSEARPRCLFLCPSTVFLCPVQTKLIWMSSADLFLSLAEQPLLDGSASSLVAPYTYPRFAVSQAVINQAKASKVVSSAEAALVSRWPFTFSVTCEMSMLLNAPCDPVCTSWNFNSPFFLLSFIIIIIIRTTSMRTRPSFPMAKSISWLYIFPLIKVRLLSKTKHIVLGQLAKACFKVKTLPMI